VLSSGGMPAPTLPEVRTLHESKGQNSNSLICINLKPPKLAERPSASLDRRSRGAVFAAVPSMADIGTLRDPNWLCANPDWLLC